MMRQNIESNFIDVPPASFGVSQEEPEDERLVDANQLLEELFDKGSRPTLRWIRKMQVQRKIPYYKIGHLVRFKVSEVREALERKCRVQAM